MIDVKAEQANFLNEEQKKIKQLIMENLFESLFGTLEKHQDKFNDQAAMDLILSCLIMFIRDAAITILNTSNMSHSFLMKENIANQIIKTIKLEIHRKLKNERILPKM